MQGGGMPDCEKLIICPFFKEELAYLPRTAALMKESYCHGDKCKCARYMVSLKGVPIPGDLFPNQVDRVPEIVDEFENHDSEDSGRNRIAIGQPDQDGPIQIHEPFNR
jgi:hypothetical protein